MQRLRPSHQAPAPARREARMRPAGVMAGCGGRGVGAPNRKINGSSFRCFRGLRMGAGQASGPEVCLGLWGVGRGCPHRLSAPWTEGGGSYRGLLMAPPFSKGVGLGRPGGSTTLQDGLWGGRPRGGASVGAPGALWELRHPPPPPPPPALGWQCPGGLSGIRERGREVRVLCPP